MKSFALAVMVAAGLIATTSPADAQFRSRRQSYQTYSYPTYSYPGTTYVSPAYYGNSSVPSYYNGQIVTSSYTPTDPVTATVNTIGSYLNQVIPGSYTPSYAYPATNGTYVYPSTYGYSSPTYYSGNSSRGLFRRR